MYRIVVPFNMFKSLAASTILFILLACSCQHCILGDSCNEFVCGSIVSKCLLMQSCQCKLSNYTCYEKCFNCLGGWCMECCSCLDIPCPKLNYTLSANAAAPKSQTGILQGFPELFETLAAEGDDDEQWTVVHKTIHTSKRRHYGAGFGISVAGGVSGGSDAIDRQASFQKTHPLSTLGMRGDALFNCTIIYLNACTTYDRCAHDCESTGASSYRWFHDGCCECVGANCIIYGINESRCSSCPEDEATYGEDDYDDEADESMWTYGEDEINHN